MGEAGRTGILDLITRGIGTAVRSWPALGVVVVVSLVWAGASALTLRATNFPQEALQELREEATAPTAGPRDAGEENVEAEELARARAERTMALLQEWVTRAWPNLLLLVVLGLFGWVWVTGGQLGYLDARLTGETSLQPFLETGRRAFAPVLQTVLAMAGLGFVLLLGFGLLTVIGQWLGALGALGALIAMLVFLAAIAAIVWIAVNLVYWLIAVAVGRRGPLDGLRVSFGAVRGHWWKTAGLLAAWGLIGMGLGVCLQVLGALLGGLGGVGAVALTGAQLIMNTLLGFAVNASLISWYRQLTQAPSTAAA